MKKPWIVTIGREFCSGGAEVAQKLAQLMNVPFYDRDLIDHAANFTSLSREIVEQNEEKAERRKGFLYGGRYRDDPSLEMPVHARIFEAQCEAIRHIAGNAPCVIVGRCADYVLGECEKMVQVINVFIRADMDKRVQRGMRNYDLSENEARKLIQKTDKIRSRFYNSHTGREWGEAGNYCLVVDTGKFGTDGAAQLIAAAIARLAENDTIEL
ncbi:MAG: cytidylate kinase-like family protein [Clostridia bacterium]|nr:cytidylate kinase-like family protein [Clostridia bacterium]